MRIVEIIAENFKRLKAIEITPQGDVVIISGKNCAGKTSVLDIMWAALGGSKGIPKEPIKKGQDTAKTGVTLGEYADDEEETFIPLYKVTRTFTKKGNYLTVENAEGSTFKSPQALLDKFIGDLSFDPLEFSTSKDQNKILLNLVGLKDIFDKIKEECDEIYTERTVVNRQVKQMEGQLDGYGFVDEGTLYDGPKETQPVQELTDQLQEARKKIDDKFHCETKLGEVIRECDTVKSKIFYLEREIEKVKKEYESLNAIRADKIHELSKMETPDISEIEVEINKRIENNEKARVWKEYQGISETYKKLQKESNGLTAKLNRQKDKKDKAIGDAKFPIKGLSYDDGIYYNGIPFEQVSDSEKLRVSISIAMALNPKIRVIRITNGSLLDSENMKIIEELAKDKDYQIWIEKVDETGKVGIYIEEGEVKSIN